MTKSTSSQTPANNSNNPENNGAPVVPKRTASFTTDILEPRILMSATWVDGNTDQPEMDATNGNDVGSGSELNDILDGLAGDDTLFGNGGNDQLFGGEGNDRLFGGDGNDILSGGNGDDTIQGGAGRDEIVGGAGNDNINLGEGVGSAWGGAGADTIVGGSDVGDNVWKGAAYNDSNESVQINLATGTASGGNAEGDKLSQINFLVGSNGDDQLTGDSSKNWLYGSAGSDTINGGGGDDILAGLDFNIDANSNAADGNDLIRGGDGNDSIKGHAGDDRLHGDAGNDSIDGGIGSDLLEGGAGNDNLHGGEGTDVAKFSGNHSDYTIKTNADGSLTITDNRAGSPDGTDTIRDVERLQFSNGIMRVISADAADQPNGDGSQLELGTFSQAAVTFVDDFNDGDMNGWKAISLGNASMNFSVVGGQVSEASDAGLGFLARDLSDKGVDIAHANSYSLSVDVVANTGDTYNNGVGMVFGFKDTNNYYKAVWRDYSVTTDPNNLYQNSAFHKDFMLVKVENGQETVVGTLDKQELPNNFKLGIEVDAQGTRVLVNGQAMITAAGTRPAVGQFGMFVYDNDGGAKYDNVRAEIHPTIGVDGTPYARLPDLVVGSSGDDIIRGTSRLGDNILVNGGFEDGQAAGTWSIHNNVSGWKNANNGEGIELWGHSFYGLWATEGSNFMELDSRHAVDAVYQEVTTEAGEQYQLTFDAAARPGVANSTNTFEVYWNNERIATINPADSNWKTHTFSVVGTGNADRLEFRELAGGNDSLGGLLDNVALRPVHSNGDNSILAGDGNDTVIGGTGNDVIDGGAGNDNLAGDVMVAAMKFDGTNDYVEINANNLPITNTFTIALTAKLEAHDDWDCLFEKVTPNGNNDFMIGFVEGKLVVTLADDDVWEGGADPQKYVVADAKDLVGEYHNYAFSYDKGTISVFIDGELVKTFDNVPPFTSNPQGRILIGADADGATDNTSDRFHGEIGNVQLYNRALSVSEVGQATTGVASNNGLVARYDFTGDNPLADKSGNGFNGTSGRAPVVVSAQISGNDRISGGEGNDRLSGMGGNDTLDGGAGNDTLIGGAGADVLKGGEGLDTVDYSSSNEGVTVLLENVDAHGPNAGRVAGGLRGDAAGDTYESVENVIGTSKDDYVYGVAAGSDVKLGDGNDTFDNNYFGKGKDNVDGGSGNDMIWTGDGADTIRGGAGNDMIAGEMGDDLLIGGTGNDAIYGGDGYDTASYKDQSQGIVADMTTGVVTSGADTDSLNSIERIEGSNFDDVFAFSNPQAGAKYSIDGGDGFNTLDLKQFAPNQIQISGNQAVVSLPGGSNFTIEFNNIDYVKTTTGGFAMYDASQIDTSPAVALANVDIELPASIDLKPGQSVSLPMDLGKNIPADAVEIRVTGVPVGAKLSAGVDVGRGEWKLNANDLNNISMTTNSAVVGDFKLQVTASVESTKPLYTEDFEQGAKGWNINTTEESGSLTKSLGRFGGTNGEQGIFKTFAVPAGVKEVVVEFDMLELDSWDGEKFQVFGNDKLIANDTYQGAGRGVDQGSQYAVSDTKNLGNQGYSGWTDQKHHYRIVLPVENGFVKLGFGSTLNQGIADEAFAIDNLVIDANHSVAASVEVSIDAGVQIEATAQGDLADGPVALKVVPHSDGASTLRSVVVENVPASMSLSAGTKLPNGSWQLNPAELQNLQASGELQGSAQLTIRSTFASTGVIYAEDFENGASGWSSNATTNGGGSLGNFLGTFNEIAGTDSGKQSVFKSFNAPPGVSEVEVQFDFLELDSWDGEQFRVFANDRQISAQTFFTEYSAYQRDGNKADSVAVDDGSRNQGLSGWGDQRHRYTIKVPVENGQFKIGFGSTLDQGPGDESWGIDNLKITATQTMETSATVTVNSRQILGTSGNDTFVASGKAEAFVGKDGIDTVDYSQSANGVTVKLDDVDGGGPLAFQKSGGMTGDATGDSYKSIENVIGSSKDDYVFGAATGSNVKLGAGNDVFDNSYVTEAKDVVDGGTGNDTIWTGRGDDRAIGGAGNDSVYGEDGNDVIIGDESSVDRDNLLRDGSFTNSGVSSVFQTRSAGQSFGGWKVERGTVDVIADYWEANGGAGSVDLDGVSPGAVSQEIATEPGKIYTVRFDMAGNCDGGLPTKELELVAGDNTEKFTWNKTSDWSRSKMGYETHEMTFVATSTTTKITFASLTAPRETSGPYFGPVIANVNVMPATAAGDDFLSGGNGDDTIFGDFGPKEAIEANDMVRVGDNLIVNGSFEDNATAAKSWGVFKSLSGWNTTSGAGIEVQDDLGWAGKASSGTSLVELDSHDFTGAGQSNSGMAQTVPTIEGEKYELSVRYSPRPGVAIESNTVEVYWNGQKIDTLKADGVGLSDTNWRTFNYTVDGAGANGKLELRAAGNADGVGGYVDDVKMFRLAAAESQRNGDDTIDGGAGNDRIFGQFGDDKISGGDGNDMIDGGIGNDRIDGGAGNDTLVGGLGNDVFIGGAGADSIDGGAGIDTIDYSKSAEGVTVKLDDVDFGGPLAYQKSGGLTGDAAGDSYKDVENIIGSTKDDYVYGAAAGSQANLGDGNDVFDNNQSRIAKDVVDGGSGNDTIWTGKGDDVLIGGAGNDTLFGEENNDELIGGEGNDVLVGGSGNDILNGGDGFDRAHFSGSVNDYNVVRNSDGSLTVTDNRPGSPDGIDRVIDVETIAFADAWLPLDTVAKPAEPMLFVAPTSEANHLTVRLGGEMGNNAGQTAEPPRYEVWANGERIATGVVDWATLDRIGAQANGFHELKFDVAPGQQLSNVSVRFTNDAYEGKAATDRNMYVDAIEVNGARFEAEGPQAKYHRGGDQIAGQEGMYWSGTMSFNTSSSPTPVHAHIAENTPGAIVGRIAAADAGTEIKVSDDRFEIKDGSLKLKDGVSLNYEEASKLELTVTGTTNNATWTRSLSLAVDNVNEAVTAQNDSFVVAEDTALKINAEQLLGNDTDIDGDKLRITEVSGAEHGTVTLLDNGQIEFKADANYSGPAKFSYTVVDAGGLTSTATVEVQVGAVADAANVSASNVSGLEDNAIALNLGANLVDSDGSEVLSVSVRGVPEGFSLSSGTRQTDGSWSVPSSALSGIQLSAPKDFHGQLELTVEATTSEASNGSTTVVSKNFTVDISDVNDTPYDIVIDNTTIVENARPGEVVAKLSASDVDDKNLSYRVIGENTKSFEVVGNELRITNQAKFSYADRPIERVTIEVSDGRGGVATREIEISISSNSRAIEGTNGNDRILGTSANDAIFAGNGDDVILGTAGADLIDGGAGRDTVDYSASKSGVTVLLEDVDAHGPNANKSAGGRGGDAEGDRFQNVENVIGSKQDDYVYGVAGGSRVELGDGNDTFDNNHFGTGQDIVSGGTGNDTIWTGDGADTLNGGSGNDSLFGEMGNDTLRGDEGDDRLSGGDGNDVLIGGSGNDRINGGSGFDQAQFSGRVTDYEITRNADGSISVIDKRTGAPDGSDQLSNVERFAFSDGVYSPETLAKSSEPLQLLSPTASANTVKVLLGGEAGNNPGQNAAPPKYEIWANGERIATGTVDWANMARYGDSNFAVNELSFEVAPGQQLNNVSVIFTNDAYEGKRETDRNMMVDAIEVNGARFEAESAKTQYYTYTSDVAGRELMPWQGAMSFNVSSAPRPTDAHIDENVPGAIVGQLAASGSNASFAVNDDRFEVRDGTLKLKDGVSLNYEDAAKIDLKVTGTSGSNVWTRDIQIDVQNVNEGPIANNDGFVVAEDTALTLNAEQLLGNDTDVDGDKLRITGVSGAEHGTVTLLDNGQIEFKADANYSGPAKFSYTVVDAGGLTSTATVEVQVGAVADAANVSASNVSGLEDNAIALNLGANLVDSDGSEVLSVSVRGVPEGFSLSSGNRQADGSWAVSASELSKIQLNAPKDFNGQVELTVEATTSESSNGSTSVVSKNFTVDIADVNDAPYEIAIDNTTIVENARPGEVVAKLSASDIDDKNLSFRVIGENTKSFEVVGNELRITNQAKFSFVDKPVERVTIEVSDGRGGVATREIEISIAANSRAIEGSNGNDSIVGTSANDAIFAGNGDDVILGTAGADVIDGGAGRDTVDYSGSKAGVTVLLEDVDAHGPNANKAAGGRGGDASGDRYQNVENVIGSKQDDYVYGVASGSRVELGDGNDTFDNNYFGAGQDVVSGGAGNDTIWTGDGADTLVGGSGDDMLDGEMGDDTLRGDEGNDRLIGGDGNDELSGGDGNDVLIGGSGNDRINGGSGFDQAQFSGRVTDYEITRNADGSISVIDKRTGAPDGSDQLSNVERFAFSDGVYSPETLAKSSEPLQLLSPTASANTVKVLLGGEAGNNPGQNAAPPKYEIWANGERIATGTVDWANMARYGDSNFAVNELSFEVAPGQQLNNVSVIFTNDAYEGKRETDRNMMVDAIEVNGTRFEAESAKTQYYTYTSDVAGRELMPWQGAMSFNVSSAPRPTDAHIAENVPGAVVGQIATVAADADLTVNDERFEIKDGLLKLKDGISLNFEESRSLDLKVTGTNGSETWVRDIHIGVDNVNEGQVTQGDRFVINEDAPLLITPETLLANDLDIDGDKLSIVGVSDAEHGTVRILENGSIRFEPEANFSGVAKFRYTVSDDSGATLSEVVEIEVKPVADGTVTNAANVVGVEDQSVALSLGAELVDADNSERMNVRILGVPDGFSLSTGTKQSDGSWVLNSSDVDNVSLNAPKNFFGKVELTLETTSIDGDSTGPSVAKPFTVEFIEQNDKPFDIQIDANSFKEGVRAGDVIGKVSASDVDDSGLKFRVVGAGAEYFEVVGNELVVKPNAVFDSVNAPEIKVTIEVDDGRGGIVTQEMAFKVEYDATAAFRNPAPVLQYANNTDANVVPAVATSAAIADAANESLDSLEKQIGETLDELQSVANDNGSVNPMSIAAPEYDNPNQYVTLQPIDKIDWSTVTFDDLVDIDDTNGTIGAAFASEYNTELNAVNGTTDTTADTATLNSTQQDETSVLSKLWALVRAYGGLRQK